MNPQYFVDFLDSNIDNAAISDADFRQIVRNTIPLYANTVYVVNSKTNEKWKFTTVVQAENFIGFREAVDPEGVVNGDYTIDDMSITE